MNKWKIEKLLNFKLSKILTTTIMINNYLD